MMAVMWIAALSAAALVFAQASTPAAASADQPAPAAQPAPKAKPEKPKKPALICTEEEQMGSFMKKRVCRTPETVEADRKSAEKVLRTCQGQGC